MDEVSSVDYKKWSPSFRRWVPTIYFPAELIKAIEIVSLKTCVPAYLCYPRWISVLKDFVDNTKSPFHRDAFHKCMKSLACTQESRSGMSPQLPSGSRPGAGDFGEWRRSTGFCRRVIFHGGWSVFTRICGGTLLTL